MHTAHGGSSVCADIARPSPTRRRTLSGTTSAPPRHRTADNRTWRNEAVCRSTELHPVDPDLFFPEPDEPERIRAAKALCERCPVRRACLDAALEHGDTYGVWGGTTEQERRLPHRNPPAARGRWATRPWSRSAGAARADVSGWLPVNESSDGEGR